MSKRSSPRQGRRAIAEHTAVRAAVALLVALLALVPVSAAARSKKGPPSPCPGVIEPNGEWLSIPAPTFPSGEQTVVDYAVDRADPNRLLITNGSSVMRSQTGGCSWENSFNLAEPPNENRSYTSTTARIVSIGLYAFGSGSLLIEEHTPLGRPHIQFTADGGATWQAGDAGLLTVRGHPLAFVGGFNPATQTPILYLLVDQSEGNSTASVSSPRTLFASEDGGQSWEQRTQNPPGTTISVGPLPPLTIGCDSEDPLADCEPKGTIDDLAVDPLNGAELWLYGSAGLFRSVDAGRTATRVDTNFVPGRVGQVDVSFASLGGQLYRFITAYSDGDPFAFRSRDGGQSFQVLTVPTEVDWATGPFIAGSGGVFQENVGFETLILGRPPTYRDLSPPDRDGQPVVVNDLLTVTFNEQRRLYGRTTSSIEYRVPFAPRYEPQTSKTVLAQLPDVDVANLGAPRLDATRDRLVLERGESRKVFYQLSLPPTPTPLDVFFLIDISGSMQDAIDGVRRGMFEIVKQLRDAGVDVWFGIGEYRAYVQPPAYKRVLDVTPPGQRLRSKLNGLFASGGRDETQLAALYQVATGAGQTVEGPGDISPGQDANFRENAVRVIIHATDAPFTEGDPNPTFEEVAVQLRARDIKQIGLAVGEGEPDQPAQVGDPLEGLRRVASDTDTTAPPQGVDCDGDGEADVDYQEPLACRLDRDNVEDGAVMAAAIVNTVRALRDDGSVALQVEGDKDLVKKVAPEIPRIVNFKEPNQLIYSVTYRCPFLKRQKRFPMKVSAARESGVLARTTTMVVCEVPTPELPPVVPPIVALLPFIPPVPGPPEVISNPNPNPQPNPQAQAQAQGAFATQEQEEPQLAYAYAAMQRAEALAGERLAEEYSFTRYRDPRKGPDPDLLFVMGAGALTCAAGLMLSRRRVVTQVARSRRYSRSPALDRRLNVKRY